MMQYRQRQRGFTLAELIVALVLFSLIAVTMGQAIVNNLHALERLGVSTPMERDLVRMRHRIMVMEHLDEVKEGGEIELPTDEGDEPMAVRWTAEVFPTSTLDLFAVDLELEFQGGGIATNHEMRLLLYRPNWSEVEDREKLSEAKSLLLEEKLVERGEVRKELEE